MLECLLNRDALDWVESQELLEKIQSLVRGFWEHRLEWNLLLEWQGADIFASPTGLDAVVILHGRGTKDIENEGQLVVIYTS